jgi:hypothetical protein
MARARDILYRFRPAGSPGAAGTAGVPVDRAADLEAELEPLFAQLADTEAACASLVEDARHRAAARHLRDVEAARVLVATARDEAAIARAAAAVAAQRAGESDLSTILARAETEAEALRQRSSAHVASYVARVVAAVRAAGVAPSTDGQGDP